MTLTEAILAAQTADGAWYCSDEPAWVPTLHHAALLREINADPHDPRIEAAMARLATGFRWSEELGGKLFFEGEVEPCINGRTLAVGAWCGRSSDALAARLVGDQLADGGWNCEPIERSTRGSFHSTICVLEGLLAYERGGGSVDVRAARARGEAYLLERRLVRRRSTGAIASEAFTQLAFPTAYHFDVLRALGYLRDAGVDDERTTEAKQIVRDKQQADGTWLLDARYDVGLGGLFDEVVAGPSRWITQRALRVL